MLLLLIERDPNVEFEFPGGLKYEVSNPCGCVCLGAGEFNFDVVGEFG